MADEPNVTELGSAVELSKPGKGKDRGRGSGSKPNRLKPAAPSPTGDVPRQSSGEWMPSAQQVPMQNYTPFGNNQRNYGGRTWGREAPGERFTLALYPHTFNLMGVGFHENSDTGGWTDVDSTGDAWKDWMLQASQWTRAIHRLMVDRFYEYQVIQVQKASSTYFEPSTIKSSYLPHLYMMTYYHALRYLAQIASMQAINEAKDPLHLSMHMSAKKVSPRRLRETIVALTNVPVWDFVHQRALKFGRVLLAPDPHDPDVLFVARENERMISLNLTPGLISQGSTAVERAKLKQPQSNTKGLTEDWPINFLNASGGSQVSANQLMMLRLTWVEEVALPWLIGTSSLIVNTNGNTGLTTAQEHFHMRELFNKAGVWKPHPMDKLDEFAPYSDDILYDSLWRSGLRYWAIDDTVDHHALHPWAGPKGKGDLERRFEYFGDNEPTEDWWNLITGVAIAAYASNMHTSGAKEVIVTLGEGGVAFPPTGAGAKFKSDYHMDVPWFMEWDSAFAARAHDIRNTYGRTGANAQTIAATITNAQVEFKVKRDTAAQMRELMRTPVARHDFFSALWDSDWSSSDAPSHEQTNLIYPSKDRPYWGIVEADHLLLNRYKWLAAQFGVPVEAS